MPRRCASPFARWPANGRTAARNGGSTLPAAVNWSLACRAPDVIGEIVDKLLTEIPERRGAQRQDVQREVEAALALGAALPDDLPGSLRLRAHRFIRGGWQFHRCISPTCGRIYPMGETQCACGPPDSASLPLPQLRGDYLRLFGNPATGPLRSVRWTGRFGTPGLRLSTARSSGCA